MNRPQARLAFAALTVVLLAAPCLAGPSQEPRLITVTGDAEVKVVPDQVVLTIGIETVDTDVDKAKQQNDKRTKKAMAVAAQYGIDKKHIQTDYLYINPDYDNRYKRASAISYTVRNTMSLTLTDLTQFESLLTSLLKAGANRVQGIRFETSDLPRHKRQARKLALQAAKQKALEMGREMGVRVGKPYRLDETTTHTPWYAPWRSGLANVVSPAQGTGSTAGTLAPGQITVKAKITASFEMD